MTAKQKCGSYQKIATFYLGWNLMNQNAYRFSRYASIRMATGFTVVELLVTIVVIGILTSLIFPAVNRAKRSSKIAGCANNLKQIIAGAMMYAEDDKDGRFGPYVPGFFPNYTHSHVWRILNSPPSLFLCPASANVVSGPERKNPDGTRYYDFMEYPASSRLATTGNSYDVFPFFGDLDKYWQGNTDFKKNANRVEKTLSSTTTHVHRNSALGLKGRAVGPSEIWLYSDADSTPLTTAFYPDSYNNHGTAGANVAFVDGHVVFVKRADYVLAYEISEDNNRDREHP